MVDTVSRVSFIAFSFNTQTANGKFWKIFHCKTGIKLQLFSTHYNDEWPMKLINDSLHTYSPARRKSCKYIFKTKQQRRKWIVAAINPTVSKSPRRGNRASQSIAASTEYSLSTFSSQRIYKCKWLAVRPGRQQLQVLLRRTDKVATKTLMPTQRQLSGAQRDKVARTCCSYI